MLRTCDRPRSDKKALFDDDEIKNPAYYKHVTWCQKMVNHLKKSETQWIVTRVYKKLKADTRLRHLESHKKRLLELRGPIYPKVPKSPKLSPVLQIKEYPPFRQALQEFSVDLTTEDESDIIDEELDIL